MKLVNRLRPAVLVLVCLGVILPKHCHAISPSGGNPKLTITDVALQEGGILRGQALDANGAAKSGVSISVKWQNRPVAETITNSEGQFEVAGLRGGLHTITSDRGIAACRFWAANTSPPNVQSNLLLVSEQTVVRGNARKRYAIASLLSNPYFMALAIGTAVIIPVAINAANDDNDSGS